MIAAPSSSSGLLNFAAEHRWRLSATHVLVARTSGVNMTGNETYHVLPLNCLLVARAAHENSRKQKVTLATGAFVTHLIIGAGTPQVTASTGDTLGRSVESF